MTNVAIVASGTRGDVQPYIALGQGLKTAGYSVRLLASENFEPLAAEAGLSFSSTGQSIELILQSDEWRQVTERGNFLSILAKMQSEMKNHATRMAQQLPILLDGSNLIVTGMGGIGGVFTLAETFKIPIIQAYVFPFTPTRIFPAPLVSKRSLGSVPNRLSFHVMRQLFWQTSKAGDKATRQLLKLPRGSFWGPYASLRRQQIPALYGYSQHVLPRPLDWPEQHHVTGYWFLNAPDSWVPPSDLVDFLDTGKPPVYIGFGSMNSRSPEEAGDLALEALALSGQRGIVASGWGGLQPSKLPHNVHLISSVPHTWLFPKLAAVVHHGGAGTTAAGLRAGIPSVIIPFMGDQPFWGRRVADLGVGTPPIPRKQLSARRLADAITEAVGSTEMSQKAKDLGRKIREEDGIATATALVERFMQHRQVYF